MQEKEIENIVIPIAIVGLGIFLIYKLSGFISLLIPDKNADKIIIEGAKLGSPFSPNYYKTPPFNKGEKYKVHLVTKAKTIEIIEGIKKATTFMGVKSSVIALDPQKLLGELQKLQYKTQVSFIAEQYFNKVGRSLLGDLADFPSKTIEIVDNYVQSLPTGFQLVSQ